MLLQKDQVYKWRREQQQAFEKLKELFTQALVLAMPDIHKPFQIECDAQNMLPGQSSLSWTKEDKNICVPSSGKLSLQQKETMKYMTENCLQSCKLLVWLLRTGAKSPTCLAQLPLSRPVGSSTRTSRRRQAMLSSWTPHRQPQLPHQESARHVSTVPRQTMRSPSLLKLSEARC